MDMKLEDFRPKAKATAILGSKGLRETVRAKGRVTIDCGDQHIVVDNLLTNQYRVHHANMLALDYPIDSLGFPSAGRYSIACGLGTVDAYPSDTVLGDELFRKAVVSRYVSRSYTARMMTTYLTTEPPVPPGSSFVTLREFGLFNESPISFSNYSFETWTSGSPDGWEKTTAGPVWAGTTSPVYHGTASCWASWTGGAPYAYVYKEYSGTAYLNEWKGREMSFHLAVREGSMGTQSAVYIADDVGGTTLGDAHSSTDQWEVLSVSKTINPSATYVRFGVSLRTKNQNHYLDWAGATLQGNLLARITQDVEKTASTPMSITWDIYLEEIEEGAAMGYKAYEFEAISQGAGGAGSLDPTKYAKTGEAHAERVIITVEDQNIRYRYDGGTPTTSEGHLFRVGGTPDDVISLNDYTNISKFRCIAVTGTAKMKVTYEH